MRPLRFATLALALAGLAALAGCGGGGGDSTEASTAASTEAAPSLTKSAFISQGDAICAEVNAAIGSVGSSESGGQTQTIQIADLYTGMVESLKGLGEPSEKAGYEEFAAAADELAQTQADVKLNAEREDPAGLSEAEAEAGPAIEGFESAASVYGFQKCGEEPSAPTPSGSGPGGVAPTPGEEEAEAAPELEAEVEPEVEEVPETGGVEEAPPESGGTGAEGGGTESGGSSGGIGPG
jgi:hypothetical protein